jgi:hypothetical protein
LKAGRGARPAAGQTENRGTEKADHYVRSLVCPREMRVGCDRYGRTGLVNREMKVCSLHYLVVTSTPTRMTISELVSGTAGVPALATAIGDAGLYLSSVIFIPSVSYARTPTVVRAFARRGLNRGGAVQESCSAHSCSLSY